MINEFNSFEVASLSIEIEQALKPILDKHGLKMKVKNSKFSSQILNLTAEFSATDTSGKSGQEAEFLRYAPILGLKPEHYGATVKLQNSFYTIIGVRPTATKNNVRIKSIRGKEYVAPVDLIIRSLVAKK